MDQPISVPLEQIQPNPYQPRDEEDPADWMALAKAAEFVETDVAAETEKKLCLPL